ncbi:hypothetical protein BEP19_12330 [Ammoniphilus oxalaticus]|uniref:L-lactate permease n=1 Tax=Ammoniphilus oxalaticus TaxID=66863 RepID=A0A419SGS7_9BACL|nr:L-lactate permease [Ammoniphilus oxalaticus]RKD23011.1 hypothetical protein BEP19_12330 [Ammoniphilus oxalaticus]
MGIDMAQVGLPELSVFTWILAALPIVLVLTLMMGFKMSGARAGGIAWVVTLVISYFAFGSGIDVLAAGSVKGLWTTVFVLFIIWASMYMYNIVDMTGSFKVIAATFTKLTNGNKMLQLLILGWAFPTFIQGVCGFGVPVAVATPLLIGLGFSPLTAVVTTLLGHSWGITFGSLGSSYSINLQLSGVEAAPMAFWGSIFIAFGGVITGFFVAHNYGGFKAIKEGFLAIVFMSVVMGGALIATCFVSPNLGCFIAGGVGLIAGSFVLPKFRSYRPAADAPPIEEDPEVAGKSFVDAFSAYIILILVVFAIYLIGPVKTFLEKDMFQIGLPFAETITQFGYAQEAAAKYSALKILTTPGTLIVLSLILAAAYYKSKGLLPQNVFKTAWEKTVTQSLSSTATIMTMTMMAVLMTVSGLTTYIAYGIAVTTGTLFPLLSPFIGILGGFVTSSGTSSNILFTGLQYEVATVLGISATIILSAQTTGASLSNSFSPGIAALGAGVSGLAGREGEILKSTLVYNILQGAAVGILAFVLIALGMGM